MSPERANVFLIENDENSRENAVTFLEMAGHRVVETASTLDEALNKIPSLTNKGVDVAIVDGNLSFGDESGKNGEVIAREIKAAHPEIVVIGHALRKPISTADVNCPKIEGGSKLAETVTAI